jgi:hypothetical protein
MFAILLAFFSSLRQGLRSRLELHAEILALRHQLVVLQRTKRGRKLQLNVADRVLWVWLSQVWNEWRSALLIIKPETVIAWHRRGFWLYWSWKFRHTTRAAVCVEGAYLPDPQDESGESPLGRAQDSWRTFFQLPVFETRCCTSVLSFVPLCVSFPLRVCATRRPPCEGPVDCLRVGNGWRISQVDWRIPLVPPRAADI